MAAELIDERDIALQWHRVLSDIDPARWRDEKVASLKARLHEVQRQLEAQPRYTKLVEAYRNELKALDVAAEDLKAQWLAFKARVGPLYTEYAAKLSEAKVHVPTLRPTNYARSLLHVGSAVMAACMIQFLPSSTALIFAALAWFTFAWTCEILRRRSTAANAALMRFFAPVAHAHEAKKVNSATWYATALMALALTREPVWCLAGVVILGVGDPLAALVGRKFGRIKLMHGRSLEGTLTFVVSGALALAGVLALFRPELSLGLIAAYAVAAAVLGAIAELVSLRVDDNLSIPLSAAAGVALVMALTS